MAERTAFALPTTVQRTVPSALTDQQYQDIIDIEVAKERERCIKAMYDEMTRSGINLGSLDSWRSKMLSALNAA